MNKNQIINKDFQTVLSQIQNAKQKAFSSVNTILIELYWEIGKYISTKTTQENWGKSVVKELATFLKEKDPTIKGFSDKNLWRMKQFFEIYSAESEVYQLWLTAKVSPTVTQILKDPIKVSPVVTQIQDPNRFHKTVSSGKILCG